MSQPDEISRRQFMHSATVAASGALDSGALAAGAVVTAAEPARPPAPVPEADPGELRIDPRRLGVAYDLMERWTTGPKLISPLSNGEIRLHRTVTTVAMPEGSIAWG